MGIKSSKVGRFWLFQIILTIIATRFIDKGIDFLIDVANNRWEPGTYLEGVTGLLAIIGATIFGIILILMFKGKIKADQPKDKEKIDDDVIEVIKEKIIDIDSKIGLAKEELDIVLDSSKYFKERSDILKRCINTNTISKIRILIGSSLDYNGTRENKQQSSNTDTNENSLFQSLLQIIKDLKQEKNKKIEIRMVNFPLFQSMIIIDPLSIEHGQMYFEHIFFPTKEKAYRNIFRILNRSKNTDKENKIVVSLYSRLILVSLSVLLRTDQYFSRIHYLSNYSLY